MEQKFSVEEVEKLKAGVEKIKNEIRKVIIGQDKVLEQVMIALFCGGHCLVEGVPGLGKTLMIRSIAQMLDLKFKRIQFTPDLMPSDIIGTDVLEEDMTTGKRAIRFIKGPVFANIILADEINRTPPKTQAALLEAMQEKEVTAGGDTYCLDLPFLVLATQNPIEQEGTYPLPEAQLDRFMFNVYIDYPEKDEEEKIVLTTTTNAEPNLEKIMTGKDINYFQKIVREVPMSGHVGGYAVRLARATRPKTQDSPDFIKQWVSWGAGPRSAQYMVLGAKAKAIMNGRLNVSCEDIRSVAFPVFRHRIIVNFNAEAEGVNSMDIIDRLLKTVPEPSEKDYK